MASNVELPTEEVPFISSTHGRERRSQRNIAKRDLQAARKYGVCESGYPHRTTGEPTWKFTHAHITYITDSSMEREITSYVEPLPFEVVQISPRAQQSYDEAKRRLAADPGSITSHTVLIMDMSGSMLKADVDGHRTRARGAYYSIAEEFVSADLHPPQMETVAGNEKRYTDVVSLIEMRADATIVFECEPPSWILYNRLVELSVHSSPSDHGNY